MLSFDELKKTLSPVIPGLPPDDVAKIAADLERLGKGIHFLETKYQRSIRERSAIHTLLKKTSDDLVQQYRTIFEYSATPMIVMEHDGTISLANSHFEQITGYSRGEIENKRTFADFMDEASRMEVAGYPARRLANDPTVPIEYEATIVTRSGEAREISVSVGIFHGTGQRIASIVDFTERNRTWKELERHRDHLAAVLSIYQLGEAGTGELIQNTLARSLETTRSHSGGILVINEGTGSEDETCDVAGWDRETGMKLIGNMMAESRRSGFPLVDNTWVSPATDTLPEGEFRRLMIVPVSESASVVTVIAVAGSPVDYSESDVIHVTILGNVMWRTIVRRRQEKSIELANNKLAILNSITRHDSLNTIVGLLGLTDMAKAAFSPAERDQLLDEIKSLGRVLEAQINFTREYQEVGVFLPQWQDLHTMVDSAAGNFMNASITIVNDSDDIAILVDPMFSKIMYNLIDNALRYGEHITKIRFSQELSDSSLVIICEDDGIGVPDELKKRIFERGFGKHTGMGLFLSREIAAITGITMAETGAPGQGARFEIHVPPGNFRTKPVQACP